MDWLQVAIRILHIGSAMLVGGALAFQLLALQPALAALGDGERGVVRQRVAGRWWPVALLAIGLLLATGLTNYLLFRVPVYRGQAFAPLYHGLFGAKFLLALALFHVALVLTGPGPRFERYRRRAGCWLTYGTLLLAGIVVLSAFLRYLPTFYD
jgi:hypothetical protein